MMMMMMMTSSKWKCAGFLGHPVYQKYREKKFLTESLMFGTVFPRALFLPPVYKHNIKSVDFSKFLTVEV